VKWQRLLQVIVAATTAAAPLAQAADNQRDLDADFLEFLGSVDAEEVGWNEYLEHADLKKPAPPVTPQAPPVKPPPTVKPGEKPSPESSR
jgi:hypothetical protein